MAKIPDKSPEGDTSKKAESQLSLPCRVDGRYQLTKLLGRGGFGAVYEATDELQNRTVAIKVIRSDASLDPTGTRSHAMETSGGLASSLAAKLSESTSTGRRVTATRTFGTSDGSQNDLRQAFKDEFRLLTQLHHPNLAEVYEFGQSDTVHGVYFTQELIDGKHITDFLKDKPREEIVDIFIQLARALDYIHALGLVHEDIKPTNILITEGVDAPANAKLIDFGLARVFRHVDRNSMVDDSGAIMILGAPGFSAPEKVRGEPTDHRSDLYSLAATMYAAVCGKRAFPARSFKDAFSAQMEWRPELAGVLLAQAGPVVAELIGRMLQPNPERRPQSARAVVLELIRREPNHVSDRFDSTKDLHQFASVLVEHLPFADRKQHLDSLLTRADEILIKQAEGGSIESSHSGSQLKTLQAVVIEAPEGMGKARLMAELRREIQIGGGLYVEGNCWSADNGVLGPFGPIVSKLATGLEARSKLRNKYRALIRLADSSGSDPEPAGQLLDYLFDCAQERPFVLHLAELAQGQEFARFEQLARAIAYNGAPILLCATSVPHSKLGPQLSSLVKDNLCEVWSLPPFSVDEMSAILSSVLGEIPVVPELVSILDKLTGGHPLSFRETVRVMIEERLLVRDIDTWRIRGSTTSVEDLQQTLAKRSETRLDALGVSAWEIASVLFLLEAPIDESKLSELTDLRLERFRRTLLRLEGEGLVITNTGPDSRQISLAHESVREAVRSRYDSSLDETRLDLATRIQDIESNDPNLLYLRARLLDDAAEHLESIEALDETADKLFAAGHTAFGAEVLQRLITRLRQHGGVDQLPKLLRTELTFLREAAGALEDLQAEKDHCEAGILMAELLHDHRAQSLFWLGLATSYTRYTGDSFDLERTLEQLDKAAEASKLAKDRELELIISNRCAEVLLVAGQVEQAGAHSRLAMQMLDIPSAKDSDICDVIGARLRCLAFSGQLDEARRLHKIGAPVAARVPAPHRLSYISGITFVALFSGDPDLAIPEIETSVQHLRKANTQRLLMAPLHNLGDLYLRSASYQKAAESFEEAIRISILYGADHSVYLNRAFLGYTLCWLGELKEGSMVLAEAKSKIETDYPHDRMMLQQVRLLDAEVAHMTGKSARARRELEEMLAEFHVTNEVSLATWAQDALARIERDLGTNFSDGGVPSGEQQPAATDDEGEPDDATICTSPVK